MRAGLLVDPAWQAKMGTRPAAGDLVGLDGNALNGICKLLILQ